MKPFLFVKFNCKGCGNCCTHLKRKMNSKITYPRYTPFYLYPEPEDVSLLIFEWEKNALQREAEKRKMKLKIIPGHISFDKEGKCIVFTWMMDYKICPFYDDICLVYKKRPLVCQSYPILETNFLKPRNATFSISSLCPHIISINQADIHTLYHIYGSTLEGAIKKEVAKIWIDNLFNYLHQNNILHKKIYAREEILEAYQKSACIGVIDYFLERNFMTKDTVNKNLQKIENMPKMLFEIIGNSKKSYDFI